MEPGESTVRVWVGLDLLQAQLMERALVDSGIECFLAQLNAVGYQAGIYEHSLWVAKKDEARARSLVEQVEEEMSAALDAEETPGQNDS